MLIRYEEVAIRDRSAVTVTRQSNVEDFIRSSFQEDHSYRDDQRSDMQVKLDGTCQFLLNLVEKLLKKGLLSLEELEELLPHKNYIRLISIDEEWDYNLR